MQETNRKRYNICYLCGKLIADEEKTKDQVPPKQIFPSHIRKTSKLNLTTLFTHRVCNEAYKEDEDYFRLSLGAVDDGNPILQEIWHDLEKSAKYPETRGLRNAVYREFIPEVRTKSGLILPNVVIKTSDYERISRVIWKITRGLFFFEFKRFLPEKTIHAVIYIHGRNSNQDPEEVREILEIVLAQPERGNHPKIFAYKYAVNPQEKNCAAWALLFWDRHLFLCAHHGPDCDCERCIQNNKI